MLRLLFQKQQFKPFWTSSSLFIKAAPAHRFSFSTNSKSYYYNTNTSSIVQNSYRTTFLNQQHQEIYERILKLLSYGEVYVGALDLRGALKKYQEALQLSKETFGLEEIETGISLHKLGDLYQIEGKFEYSLECYTQAMAIFVKNSNTDNGLLIAGLNHSVGLFYKHTDDFQRAITYLLKSAQTWNNTEEPGKALLSIKFALETIENNNNIRSFPDIPSIYELAGDLYTQIGEFPLAENYLGKAKELKLKHFEKNSPEMGSVLVLSGFLSKRRDDTDTEEATKLIQKGIRLCAKSSQKDLALMARGYAVLGSIKEAQENFEEAVKYYKLSYRLFKKDAKRPEDIRLARVLSYAGTCYFYQNKSTKALECFLRSLEMAQKLKTNDVDFLATLCKNISTIYMAFSENDKAVEFLEKAIHFKEKLLVNKERDVEGELASLYTKLGIVKANLGEFGLAKENFEKALEIYTSISGGIIVNGEAEVVSELLEETKNRIKSLQQLEIGLEH